MGFRMGLGLGGVAVKLRVAQLVRVDASDSLDLEGQFPAWASMTAANKADGVGMVLAVEFSGEPLIRIFLALCVSECLERVCLGRHA